MRPLAMYVPEPGRGSSVPIDLFTDGCCKLCGGVAHLAKDCPNKGNRSSGMSNEFGKRWNNTFIIYEANYCRKCGDDEKSDNVRTQQSTIEMHDDDEKSLLNQMLSLRPTQQWMKFGILDLLLCVNECKPDIR
ncbi:DNA-binding protein HEXBP [Tanacetum coccineum]